MISEQYERADSLNVFLSGASSDGGAQSDPDASFGNYRSSTLVELIGYLIGSSIPGIEVLRVGPQNGFGVGVIEAVGANLLRWTAPGETVGDTIEILNNTTRLLEAPTDPRKFIVVKRDTSADLYGKTIVNLLPVYNNAIGMSNVSESERAAGEIKIRCIVFRCMDDRYSIRNLRFFLTVLGTQRVSDSSQLGASGSGTITTTGSLADWPDVGFCRIETSAGSLREIVYYSSRTATALTVPTAGRGMLGTTPAAGAATDKIYPVPPMKIATETPVSQQFTEISNENDTTPVSGFSWSTAITQNSGLAVAGLAKDEMVALWLWMQIPAGATGSPSFINAFTYNFGVFDILML